MYKILFFKSGIVSCPANSSYIGFAGGFDFSTSRSQLVPGLAGNCFKLKINQPFLCEPKICFCNLVWCFLQDWILKDEGESSFWAPLLRNFCFLNFHFFSGLFVSHDSNIFLETNSILKILLVTNFRFCCVTTVHIFFSQQVLSLLIRLCDPKCPIFCKLKV